MATEHDHLVRFVSATNLANRVVRSTALGIDAVDDVELEHDFGAVVENTTDASEVFITHHHRRYHFVNVKRAVVESPDLSKLAPGIIDSNESAIGFEKLIELLCNLAIGKRLRRIWCRRRSWRWRRENKWFRVWSITSLRLFVSLPFWWWVEIHGYGRGLADEYDFSAYSGFLIR